MATDDATPNTAAWQRMGLGVLATYVPAALIDEVLAETGRVQKRLRRLPARVVVLFVLALTIFAGQGYRDVWRELVHSEPDGAPTPSRTGLSQARRRVGVPPLAELFARIRGVQATPDTPGAFLAGLRLVSVDATTLDVPDTPANTGAFIAWRNKRGVGAFPKVRLLTLIEVATHAVIDAAFGCESEQVLARRVLPSLRAGMLLVADRNFPSFRLWADAAGTGAQLLWRIKTSTVLPRLGTLTDGSHLALLPRPGTKGRWGTWVRVIDYQVTVTTDDDGRRRQRVEAFRLITTILNPAQATATELAACYHQRWESENHYKSIKTHQRGPRQVLRSKDPDGIRQEIYAYLITYQAIRALLNQAAATVGVDPDRLSFTTTLRLVRRYITSTATAAGQILLQVFARALVEILDEQHDRRDRISPRVVKRSQNPYPAKRHAKDPRSRPVTYTITTLDGARQ